MSLITPFRVVGWTIKFAPGRIQDGKNTACERKRERERGTVREALCCSVLQIVEQRVAVCCNAIQYVAECRNVLQCVAVCCSV